ncbi:MAG: FecR/PupR family sigma factor regulator [Symbiopectobacterium sp.]
MAADAARAAEWQRWCEQDERHERVYHQMQQLWFSAALTPATTSVRRARVRRARNGFSFWPWCWGWWACLPANCLTSIGRRINVRQSGKFDA